MREQFVGIVEFAVRGCNSCAGQNANPQAARVRRGAILDVRGHASFGQAVGDRTDLE